MAYTPITWERGDAITSARLNHIEEGIESTDEYVESLKDAVENAGNDQIPMANGDGTWDWKTPKYFRAANAPTQTMTFPEVDDTGTSQEDVWSSSKTNTELNKKLDKPDTDGTNGQVLATDGSGNTSWVNMPNAMTIDSAPASGSTNPVASGGVYSALMPVSVNISDVITTAHTLNTNSCHVEKLGKIVMLTVSITMTSDVQAYGTIASLKEGYRPIAQIWGRCFGLDYDITGGGNIRPMGGAFASGKTMSATIVYCTA